jgi:hypothetical protein
LGKTCLVPQVFYLTFYLHTITMTIEDVAKVCHAANKAYCEANGDFTQISWDLAPEWQKTSAINGVKFHISGPAGVEDSHNNWMKEKVADGWVYGPIKNADLKLHPCIVPFDELPESQKAKDYLFRGIVYSLKTFVDAENLN